MTKLEKALTKALEVVLALCVLGGVMYNLNIIVDIKWWQTIIMFVVYLVVHNIEKLFPYWFNKDR